MSTIYEDPSLYERQVLPRKFWTGTLDAIIDVFGVKTAMDYGCGLGVDVVMMWSKGLEVYGVDGSERLRKHVLFPAERYLVHDLTQKTHLAADLIWCREVAEHLPEELAGALVKNIASNALKVIYFTAAHPGQIGHQHINLQPISYWMGLFEEQGWVLAETLTAYNAKMNPHPDDRDNGIVLWHP